MPAVLGRIAVCGVTPVVLEGAGVPDGEAAEAGVEGALGRPRLDVAVAFDKAPRNANSVMSVVSRIALPLDVVAAAAAMPVGLWKSVTLLWCAAIRWAQRIFYVARKPRPKTWGNWIWQP